MNGPLEEEADDLVGAGRYERTAGREVYRAGRYGRSLTTTGGNVTLRVPRLKGMRFATAITERYRRREAIAGMPMYRDMESMEPGDLVIIEAPWDTLTYRMVEHRAISYNDLDAVRPVADRALVTLLTCHPYGYNYRRYLVICERVDASVSASAAEDESNVDESGFSETASAVDDSLLAALLRGPCFWRWSRVIPGSWCWIVGCASRVSR